MDVKQVLGLVASHRKAGNTEIVVKKIAEKMEGWELSLIRLPDLTIRPCKGCYACLLPGVKCNITDDMEWLLDRISGADALIVAAPNYVLGPVGIMKMIADRTLQASPRYDILRNKKAAVALTLGREEYRGYADTALVSQVSALGLRVTGIELFHGTFPGEAVLDEDFENKISRLASSLLQGRDGEAEASGRCPRCHSDLFRLRKGALECALCKSLARQSDTGLEFYFFHPEFGEEGQKEHMQWLLGKKEQYATIRERLTGIQKQYRGGRWLTPGGSQ